MIMNLSSLGLTVRSEREAGSIIQIDFLFPDGNESSAIVALLARMEPGWEVLLPDPESGECSLQAQRVAKGHQVKRGGRGTTESWRNASPVQARDFLLPGARYSNECQGPRLNCLLNIAARRSGG
jgi:hypothetical protein